MDTNRTIRAALCALPIALAACSDNGTSTEPVRQGVPAAEPSLGITERDIGEGRSHVRIVRATGDIRAAFGNFRDLIGGDLNGAKIGDQGPGRREINWDGVPAGVTNTDAFPGNFFNVNSPRGLVATTPGSGFRVSDNGFTVGVNPQYAGEFVPFSPFKLFAAVGSTITDVQFFVAGNTDPATVTAFGSVFEDVGRARSTTIEYFDAAGRSLLKLAAPRRSDDNGISFVGAVFDSPIVASVRITAGDTPLSATTFDNVKGAGQKHDLVVMDDFIYGEPHKIN